jgi:formiminoglutamate deiminase
MTAIHAASALTPTGWQHDVRVSFHAGFITAVEPNVLPSPTDERVQVLIPGMPNVHSHAFQRAMAGLTEFGGPACDNFWTWRSQMYRFALAMTPDDVEAVAAHLYMEMLESGFTRVGEFHYLHHDPTGTPYANPAEMAERIAAAAGRTGIALTLLPSFYAHSGFGGAPPLDGQRRFICDTELFALIVDGCRAALSHLPNANLGLAPHSLRAVTPEELSAVLSLATSGPLSPATPIHLHAAEQSGEVAQSLAWSGRRPIEWLLDNAPLDARWCVIHATHMTPDETRRLAATGATAGLCPITEANLGDGTFPAQPFLAAQGRIAIGSDSNVLIGVPHELRQLEYAQRLAHHSRNPLTPPNTSTAQTLFTKALTGGSAALGLSANPRASPLSPTPNSNIVAPSTDFGITPTQPADLVSLNTANIPWSRDAAALNAWIFTATTHPDSVWTQGTKRVANGTHLNRPSISATFQKSMRRLLATT